MEETMMNVTEELVMETKGTKIGRVVLLVAGAGLGTVAIIKAIKKVKSKKEIDGEFEEEIEIVNQPEKKSKKDK